MFLQNYWYVAGWTYQFPAGEILMRTILGIPLVLYRTASGEMTALEDRCCHRFAPLSKGRLEGNDIRCMYHGLKFAASGQCVEIPSRETVPAGVAVRAYPVVEKDRWVWVWMGDAALADTALIPRAIGHEDAEYTLETSEMHYGANYQLVHDNVLDLTHLSFLHESTFGQKGTKWGQAPSTFTRLERGVRVQRWLPDHPVAPYMGAEKGLRMDQWASHDFVVPGVLLLTVASYQIGTAEAFPAGPGDLTPVLASATSHAVTPIDDNNSICYYSVGQLSHHAAPDRVLRQMKLFEGAFVEDKNMLEAQQKIVDRSPGKLMMAFSFDQVVTQFRRLIAALIKAEAPGESQSPRNLDAMAELHTTVQ